MAGEAFEVLEFRSFAELCEWYLSTIDDENARPADYSFQVLYGECRMDGGERYHELEVVAYQGAPPRVDVPRADEGEMPEPERGRFAQVLE